MKRRLAAAAPASPSQYPPLAEPRRSSGLPQPLNQVYLGCQWVFIASKPNLGPGAPPSCKWQTANSAVKMINEVDLKTLWKELDAYEVELEEEENTLREVWVKMALLKGKNERDAEE